MAAAISAALMTGLTGCGGSGSAAPPKTEDAELLGERFGALLTQGNTMDVVEWHGQMLTKNPDKGGTRIFDLNGRFSPSTGSSEVSMDSTMEGDVEQIDYLVVDGRTYFNSEDWGPGASGCWADITGDEARGWGLPTDLNPIWPLTSARAIDVDGDDVSVSIPFKQVLSGLPRGLLSAVPSVPYDTEADAFITPHGPLIEVGIDVQGMWNRMPKAERASIDTRRAGWWAMTMKESQDASAVQPPKNVFDPAVTPPSQCMKA